MTRPLYEHATDVTKAYAVEHQGHPAAAGVYPLAVGARALVAEVWRLVELHAIDARSRAADVALDLRDSLDPHWYPTADLPAYEPDLRAAVVPLEVLAALVAGADDAHAYWHAAGAPWVPDDLRALVAGVDVPDGMKP